MMTENEIKIKELIESAFNCEKAKKAVISKLDSDTVRLTLQRKSSNGRSVYQTEEAKKDGKVITKNHINFPSFILDQFIPLSSQINLMTVAGDCEYRKNKKGNSVIIGDKKLISAMAKTEEKAEIADMQRKKNYFLSGEEEFLYYLGISDKDGKVLPSRQAKFRQTNRFLEYLSDILPSLGDGELTVFDLCCGKCYLSFAVYHYLTKIKNRKVTMLCADLKADVLKDCEETAKRLGFSNMTFIAEDIRKLSYEKKPDLVLSLHACDIATDIVLETAVKLGAKAVLSTPCCHRDLSKRISSEPLSFVYRHTALSDKLCTPLTDALRLLYLESEGYKVKASELVDPDNTPKNIILIAERNCAANALKKAEEAKKRLIAAKEFLGIS